MTLSPNLQLVVPSLWDILPLDMQRLILNFKQTMEARDKYNKVVQEITESMSTVARKIDDLKDMSSWAYMRRTSSPYMRHTSSPLPSPLPIGGTWQLCTIYDSVTHTPCSYTCDCNAYVLCDGDGTHYRWKVNRKIK